MRSFRCFDPDAKALAKLASNLRGQPGLEVELCTSIDDALRGAEIITTATAAKRRQTLLTSANVPAGAHINAIGGDCPGKTELDSELIQRARVFVEYEPQTRIEGEIQQLNGDGDVNELWRLIAGDVPGRTHDGQITLFDSVGFALEDFSTLRYVRQLAISLGVGHYLPLIPEAADPKNLFAALT